MISLGDRREGSNMIEEKILMFLSEKRNASIVEIAKNIDVNRVTVSKYLQAMLNFGVLSCKERAKAKFFKIKNYHNALKYLAVKYLRNQGIIPVSLEKTLPDRSRIDIYAEKDGRKIGVEVLTMPTRDIIKRKKESYARCFDRVIFVTPSLPRGLKEKLGTETEILSFNLPLIQTQSIKLEDEKKEKLDKFLAKLLVQENIRISTQELMGVIIDFALENEEDFINRLRKLPPLEEDPAWKGLENPMRWGIKDSSKRIDEFLYGR